MKYMTATRKDRFWRLKDVSRPRKTTGKKKFCFLFQIFFFWQDFE